MFADSLRLGRVALYMPKHDKNDAFKGLILGHEVLQKCNNFFQSDLGLISNQQLGWKKVPSPHITGRGASEQQPKRGTICLLLQYGFEFKSLAHLVGRNKSLCTQDGVGNPQTFVPRMEFD